MRGFGREILQQVGGGIALVGLAVGAYFVEQAVNESKEMNTHLATSYANAHNPDTVDVSQAEYALYSQDFNDQRDDADKVVLSELTLLTGLGISGIDKLLQKAAKTRELEK